eukprot:TRINITY_DN1307_c0_g1_i1.p2 TRINITY_DN1307_c0_g1~~TRINITY_DN1307_c0_g1_i1.p2  ORF type:complete len:123 (-),score=30.73 TRINITY_DN1307_c0_g1_i1:189-557(-)
MLASAARRSMGFARFCTAPKLTLPSLPSLKVQWYPPSPREEFVVSKMRIRVQLSDLKLSEVESEFLQAIAGPRCTQGTLQLVVRDAADEQASEQALAQMLKDLVEESKALSVEHPGGLKDLE